ncbi:hypothetical protein BGW39_000263, partial [Mortierella sp. 14UC]
MSAFIRLLDISKAKSANATLDSEAMTVVSLRVVPRFKNPLSVLRLLLGLDVQPATKALEDSTAMVGNQKRICQDDAGCRSKAPSRTPLLGNEEMVCNKKPEVFYSSFMTCGVSTPELDTFFPGSYALTLDMDVINKTINAQMWIDNAEHKKCSFFFAGLAGFFPDGLQMVDCDMGECVFPSEMISSLSMVKGSLAVGVVVGLAILGALILFLIIVCSIARKNQILLSRLPCTIDTEAASLEFRNVGYTLNKDGLEILKGISGSAPAG